MPNTRWAARVLAEVPSTLLIDVPADTEVSEPIVVDLDGKDVAVTEAGHVAMRFGAHSKAIVVLNHTGSSTIAAVVEIASVTAPTSRSSRSRTGPTTPSTCRTTRPASVATRPTSTPRSPSAATWCGWTPT